MRNFKGAVQVVVIAAAISFAVSVAVRTPPVGASNISNGVAVTTGQAPQYTYRSGFYYPVQGGTGGAVNIIQTNGTESAMPFFVPTTTTFTKMVVWVVTAGSAGAVVRFGIYLDNGGRPGNLLLDGGTAATTSTGAPAEVTISQTLNAGQYWVCLLYTSDAADE